MRIKIQKSICEIDFIICALRIDAHQNTIPSNVSFNLIKLKIVNVIVMMR
jgi:hypothetical protein